MGIIAHLKILAPLTLYILGGAFFLNALIGRVRWALALVVLLLPLRNVIEKLQEFPLGNQFLDLLILAMIVGWCLSTMLDRKALIDKSALNFAAFLLVIYMTFSLFLGSYKLEGELYFDFHESRVQDWKNYCLMPLLFFLTANNLPDKKWVWRIFGVTCFTMTLMAYYTTSQISSFSSLESREKINGTFQFLGPNEVAAFLNQYTMILVGVYFFMKKKLYRLFLLALILVNIYCILFLYSRGAYLGLGVGLFLMFLFKNKKMLIPLILVAVLWQAVLPQKAVERIKGTKNAYGELDLSSERRLYMWKVGMQLFKESPLVGIGYGVFRYLGFELGDTHNIYVKILVEQGVVGLLVFLFLIFCFMVEGFRLYQKGEDDASRGLGLGLFVCMFVLLVNNFFGDRWAYFELSAYLWIYAGLAARLYTITSNKEEVPPVVAKQNTDLPAPVRKVRKSYYK